LQFAINISQKFLWVWQRKIKLWRVVFLKSANHWQRTRTITLVSPRSPNKPNLFGENYIVKLVLAGSQSSFLLFRVFLHRNRYLCILRRRSTVSGNSRDSIDRRRVMNSWTSRCRSTAPIAVDISRPEIGMSRESINSLSCDM